MISEKPTLKQVYFSHIALILSQCAFGGGCVFGKLALNANIKPLMFALVREAITGPILILIAYIIEKDGLIDTFYQLKTRYWRFVLTGLALYLNQLLFIIGLSLSTPTSAAIWQPSQPIFTATIAVFLRWEKLTLFKSLGILFAVTGASTMVAFQGSIGGEHYFIASLCFAANCISTSFYVIMTKPLLKLHPPVTVTAFSYIVASSLMALSSLYYANNTQAWIIPTTAYWSLAYWIVFASVMAYMFMTWANKYVDASIVSTYNTLQPLVAAIVSYFVFNDLPGYSDIGGLGILIGLILVAWDSRLSQVHKVQETRPLLSSDEDSESINRIDSKET